MLLPILSLVQRAALPTAPEAIRRCQAAYDSVRTFEQDVVGGGSGYRGTAHVSFSRPGRLRVSGTTGFGTAYDLLSTPGGTWLLERGSWQRKPGAEMGIATITGTSAQAGTLAPAMLMHTAWGSLSPLVASGWKVASETSGGRTLLRLTQATPFPTRTWIDARTHFVVRTETAFNGRTTTVAFSPPVVDRPIPESRFRR